MHSRPKPRRFPRFALRRPGRRPGSGATAFRFPHAALPILLLAAASVWMAGCDEETFYGPGNRPPAAPQGFVSVTGDEQVELYWIANTERDLAGYRVYRGTEPRGYYPKIATLGPDADGFVDRDVVNGRTYYYAIAAFDEEGLEGDLSNNPVFDTPRPAGRGLRVANSQVRPEEAGLDFSHLEVLDYRDLEADLYFWSTPEEGPWMVATERSDSVFTDIQDAGYASLDEIDWAPDNGWAPRGEVPLVTGHSYVVWTWDDHYAKFRVIDVSPDRVVIDWAYQVDRGNTELSLPAGAPRTRGTAGLARHQMGIERRLP